MAQPIKVELESLSDLRYKMMQTIQKLNAVAEVADQRITEEFQRLESVRAKKEDEKRFCEQALDQCLSWRDDDGRSPPCSGEYSALRNAQEELWRVEIHIEQFTSEANRHRGQIAKYQETSVAAIEGGRDYLERHIQAGLEYIRGNNIPIDATPGEDPHGPEFQRARRRFYRETANGDFFNTPAHLRGWVRQEAQHGTYDAPYDNQYDVAHYVRNINIPENFYFDTRGHNRGMPNRARRYNVHHF